MRVRTVGLRGRFSREDNVTAETRTRNAAAGLDWLSSHHHARRERQDLSERPRDRPRLGSASVRRGSRLDALAPEIQRILEALQ